MISSVAALIRRTFGQQVARTNAAQASARLGHRRREREAVASYLAELSDERNQATDVGRPSDSDVAASRSRRL